MEAVTPEELRRQFDVDVFGQIAVTQAVLTRLRRSKGRIVFISSANGRVAVPLIGAYCASKFALEAAADALRMELGSWDIPVLVVEPAQTDTDMRPTAETLLEATAAAMSPMTRELYDRHIQGSKKVFPKTQKRRSPGKGRGRRQRGFDNTTAAGAVCRRCGSQAAASRGNEGADWRA